MSLLKVYKRVSKGEMGNISEGYKHTLEASMIPKCGVVSLGFFSGVGVRVVLGCLVCYELDRRTPLMCLHCLTHSKAFSFLF